MATQSREGLVAWVGEGIEKASGPSDSFPSDGRLYLFSALRPASPPEGSLHLITLDDDWLSAFVLILIILPGLGLLRARAPARLLAAGLFVVLLIAAGIFFPTLSRQVVDGKLAAGVLVVLVAWFLHYQIRIRPNDPEVIARRQARLARLAAKGAAAQAPTVKDTQEGGASHA